MSIFIIVVFVLGYLAIALEHNIKIDKAASALVTGMVCWAIYVFSMDGTGHEIQHIIEHGVDGISYRSGLVHHLFDIGSILFFPNGRHDDCRISGCARRFCGNYR